MSAPDLGLLASQACPVCVCKRERERESERARHVLVHFAGVRVGASLLVPVQQAKISADSAGD